MPITPRQLLYAMLAALGLAGVSGVLALAVGDTGTVWRVAGTSLTAAFAAAIMMPMAAWADKPTTRLAGLVGMSVAVVLLVLAGLLIWGEMFSVTTREFLAWLGAIIAGTGLVGARFLKELHTPGWRIASLTGAIGAAAAALMLAAGAFDESFRAISRGEDFFASGMAILGAAVTSALCLIGLARPDARWWRWVGVLGSAAGAGMVLYGSWIEKGDAVYVVVGAYALGATIAHALACLRVKLDGWQRWVRVIAIGSAGATAALVTILSDSGRDWSWHDNGFWRVAIASGLMCLSASMALIVFVRLNKRPVVQLAKATFDRITVTCPRCERTAALPLGGALCERCKLHINITIQTSRCGQCGYDLADLRSDRCPECGAVLPISTKGLTETAS